MAAPAQSRGVKRPLSDADFKEHKLKRKRNEGPVMDIRVLLKSRYCGGIIGKAGEKIKSLRKEFKANILLPDSFSPERIFSVNAPLGTAMEALLKVMPTLNNQLPTQRLDQAEVRLLIHDSQTGQVIGKKGQKVKDLRQLYDVDIKVFHQCCPFSSERVVQIIGHPTEVINCATNIYEIISKIPPKGNIVLYDPNNCSEGFADEYGGYTGTSVYRKTPGSNYGMLNLRNAGSVSNNDRPITQPYTIPTQFAGAILGPGGSRLRQVQSISNTTIRLKPTQLGQSTRIITIQGLPDNVLFAQFLLQLNIRRFSGIDSRPFLPPQQLPQQQPQQQQPEQQPEEQMEQQPVQEPQEPEQPEAESQPMPM